MPSRETGRSSICPCPTRGCTAALSAGSYMQVVVGVCVGRGEERRYFWSGKRKRSAWKGGSLAEEKGGEIPKELLDCLCVYRNNHAPSEVWSIVSRGGGREIGYPLADKNSERD